MAFLLFLLLTGLTALGSAQPYLLEKGNLPVLIVAPHGGEDELPGAEVRSRERSGDPHFATVRDLLTTELARLYSEEMVTSGDRGKRPSLLVSNIHRRYCDLNREEQWSSHHPAGRAFHRQFHNALQQELSRLKERFGWVLLLDIHGQSAEPVDLMVGTRRGETIGRWSHNALWGPEGLLSELNDEGFTAVPSSPEVDLRFDGGYIVKRYSDPPAVEAWQLEHGRALRFDQEANLRFVKVFAERLVALLGAR